MSATLARTPLYDWHARHGAKLVDFAGWSMPIQYESIVVEHQATRQSVGLFDVSHMGRFCFAGPGAVHLLNGLLTRRVDNLGPGQVRYSLVTNDAGGVLDDVLVSRLTTHDESIYWLVVNASNREKLVDWVTPRLASHDANFRDETLATAMIAIQGPRALEIVDEMFSDGKPSELKYYTAVRGLLKGVPVTVSRTGYTGEDGVEFVVPVEEALPIWERLATAADTIGGRAVGLAARDTLRLEAGMPLYGHELSEDIHPFQAGLGFAVHLENRSFPGHDALSKAKNDTTAPRRVGLLLGGRRVPREQYAICAGDTQVGEITSGTFSPTLQQPIAMGYVKPEFAMVDQELNVDIRGRYEIARVVKLPFYKRTDR